MGNWRGLRWLISDRIDSLLEDVDELTQLVKVFLQVFLVLLHSVPLLSQFFNNSIDAVQFVNFQIALVLLKVRFDQLEIHFLLQFIDLVLKFFDISTVVFALNDGLLNDWLTALVRTLRHLIQVSPQIFKLVNSLLICLF